MVSRQSSPVPVGKPLGDARSGLRMFLVTDEGITHKYYDLGNLPTAIDVGVREIAVGWRLSGPRRHKKCTRQGSTAAAS